MAEGKPMQTINRISGIPVIGAPLFPETPSGCADYALWLDTWVPHALRAINRFHAAYPGQIFTLRFEQHTTGEKCISATDGTNECTEWEHPITDVVTDIRTAQAKAAEVLQRWVASPLRTVTIANLRKDAAPTSARALYEMLECKDPPAVIAAPSVELHDKRCACEHPTLHGKHSADGCIVDFGASGCTPGDPPAPPRRFDTPGRKWMDRGGDDAKKFAPRVPDVERDYRDQPEYPGVLFRCGVGISKSTVKEIVHPRSLKGRVNVAALGVDDPNGDDVA